LVTSVEKTANKYLRKWRILEMEQWHKDFMDKLGEGHITFEKKTRGEFQLEAEECNLDCLIEKVGDLGRIAISFLSQDERDEVSERAWRVREAVESSLPVS
jgi:hypothetical protein